MKKSSRVVDELPSKNAQLWELFSEMDLKQTRREFSTAARAKAPAAQHCPMKKTRRRPSAISQLANRMKKKLVLREKVHTEIGAAPKLLQFASGREIAMKGFFPEPEAYNCIGVFGLFFDSFFHESIEESFA